jgi:hypothetical protein
MGFIENINRIDFILKTKYRNVKINEFVDFKMGNCIRIVVEDKNKVLDAVISKSVLENNTFEWYYKSNPLDDESVLVERVSNVDSFGYVVEDIFEENRFDSNYLKNIR